MKTKRLYQPYKWECALTLMSSGIVVWSYFIDFAKNGFLVSVLIGSATCVLTAILILYIQRVTELKRLHKHYSVFEGKYKRVDMGQDNSGENENDGVKQANIGLPIKLTYMGGHTFSGIVGYWRDSNASATAAIEFDKTNKVIGSGTYKYDKGSVFENQFGTYQVFLFTNDANKIYVKYQHVFPRELKYNPDNNRGWEVWEKA